MVKQFATAGATGALCNVRRNRDGRTLHLGCNAKTLGRRQTPTDLVDVLYKIDGTLPHDQILV